MLDSSNYLDIVSKDLCTGCMACSSICPVGAISVQEDEEGFLFPAVDKEKCTNCRLCKSVCPILNSKFHEKPATCFAVMASDEIRMKSSSGGVFTVIAEHILAQGGYVCGAVFDGNWNVRHIIVDNVKDLDKLRGSKYVQSFIGNIYKDIKVLLENGKTVLFTGTPCQVAGLINFLGREYPNLLTIDIVCHGVPNSKIWQKYLSCNFDKVAIKKINFRDKVQNGWSCTTTTTLTNGEVSNIQSYFDGFNNNLFLRKSCSCCNFTKMNRYADLTFADFWGIWEFDADMNDGKGTSLLLLNSDKAKTVFNKLKDKFIKIKDYSSNLLDGGLNYPLYRSSVPHRARGDFFAELERTDNFNELVYNMLAKPYDVGLFGLWYGGNYGGFLTYWALYKFLEKNSYSVLLIDNCKMVNHEYINSAHSMMTKFCYKYGLNCTNSISTEAELYDLNTKVNNFIVGSDQIWNYGLTTTCYFNYLLDFVYSYKNKIAYASSFGSDASNVPKELTPKVAYYLNNFDGISVRESSGVELLKNEFSYSKGVHLLDPVFFDSSLYEVLIENSSVEVNSPYIFSYLLDPELYKEDILRYVEQMLNMSPIITVDINPKIHNYRMSQFSCFSPVDATIEDWLKYIKNCDFVITDSFHGMCFAILYKKNFVAIANKMRGEARFLSLLSQLGLSERLIYSYEDLLNNESLFKPIDYEKVFLILNAEKDKSISWLLTKLHSQKPQIFSEIDLYNELSCLMMNNSDTIKHLSNCIGDLHGQLNSVSETNQKLLSLNNELNFKIKCLKNRNYNRLKYYSYRILTNFVPKNLKEQIRLKKEKYKKFVITENTL